MQIEHIKNDCTGCSSCKTICPTHCITVELDEEGFYFPKIDATKCLKCGKCESVCHCLYPNEIVPQKTTYYGWHKDAEKRQASSSGGAFIALADEIIRRDGVVYGAAFDLKKRKLRHISNEKASLAELQKSKYVESDLVNCFSEIQQHLNEGKWVLFCGTPCQASGLRKAVKDLQNRLIICDFICHGVPSSEFFKDHLNHILHKKEELLEVDFRPKDLGWSSKNITLRTRTRTRTRTRHFSFDSYYYGFMSKNVFLRRSCYECKHRQNHSSDITIADFWGYRKLDESLNDERGLSLIIANNDRGRELVESTTNEFNLHKIDNQYSDYAYDPKDYSVAWKERKEFYTLVNQFGFEKAARKTYMKNFIKRYTIYNIKNVIKKIIGRN